MVEIQARKKGWEGSGPHLVHGVFGFSSEGSVSNDGSELCDVLCVFGGGGGQL